MDPPDGAQFPDASNKLIIGGGQRVPCRSLFNWSTKRLCRMAVRLAFSSAVNALSTSGEPLISTGPCLIRLEFISNKHCEIRYKDGGCRWWKHRAANREMFCRPSTRGWVSAIVVNAIWRQREADDEARKRLVGDYSPTFFERVRVGIDAKFYKGRKPPRFLPQYMPMARLDDAYSHSEDGKRSLHDDDGH